VLPSARHADVETPRAGAAPRTIMRVAFELVCAHDGSSHVIEVFSEASDENDKATAKAMSAAYKTAMVQTFCIPVVGLAEPDLAPRSAAKAHLPEPVQGWPAWSLDIIDIVSVCESEQALDTVQELNRDLFKALSRERPETYEKVGNAFAARRAELNAPKLRKELRSRTRTAGKRPRKERASSEQQYA
jgi:hypothetical protein